MATTHKFDRSAKVWTYGAEMELNDWPRREKLPDGMALDEDWSLVNSNGVAVDGPGKLYHLGGEILTRPSESPEGAAQQLAQVMMKWPQTTVNHRTGVHIHIRVPGLRDDLDKLKRLQRYIHAWMPELLTLLDHIPKPTPSQYPIPEEYRGARKYYARQIKGQHYLLPHRRFEMQMEAKTTKEFFNAEAIHLETKKIHWAIRPRACVNLRQLLQTDTVEFRHFYGTTSPLAVLNATKWCRAFLEAALLGDDLNLDMIQRIMLKYKSHEWPKFIPYVHWLEKGYRFTSAHYHTPTQVSMNIREWLASERPKKLVGEEP